VLGLFVGQLAEDAPNQGLALGRQFSRKPAVGACLIDQAAGIGTFRRTARSGTR